MCYEEKDTVFSPCGHFITCSNCSLCRKHINSTLKRSELSQ